MQRAMPLSRAMHKSAVGMAGFTSYSVPEALARQLHAELDMEMQGIGGRLKAIGAFALVLALAPTPLAAQSGETYRLPGATVQPAGPGAQGPVDRDNPVVTKSVLRPVPSATPDPTPTPSPVQPGPTASAAASRTPAPRPATAAPRQTAIAPASQPPATPEPGLVSPAAEAPLGAVPAAPLPADFGTPAPPPAAAEVAMAPGWYWPWIAGAAALLALVFAGLWTINRRREPKPLQIDFERPVVAPAKPASAPELLASPAPAPIQALPLSAVLPAGLGVMLEARRMSASLLATTLSYSLTLTNTGTEALSALAVEGDMVSAHASLPPEAQIANDSQRLELRHALVTLAPGESAEFSGDFRLPLTAVTPIRAGDAAYFVPLARLRIEASTPSGSSMVQVQTFVVGELPEAEGAALKPFRLDLGPRTYSRIGQRAVN